MTVQALRALAIERNIGSGTWRAGASKAALIQGLTSGVTPASDPAAALSAALLAMMPTPGLDEDRVRQLIREEIPAPPTIRIEIPGRPEVEMARQHERFPLLLQVLACGLSVGPQTSKSDLLGFVDAGGTYRESMFVSAYRDGGVFLLDEIDAGNAGVLTVLNAALAGDVMATPIGMVKRSPRFLTVAGANTYGQGASRQDVGRNQLDAATLDRFAVLDWPVDEGLEAAMVGLPAPAPTLDLGRGGLIDAAAWLGRVRSVRASVEKEQVRAVVSPRATVAGVSLLAAGVGRFWVEEMVLWRGMPVDARTRVEGGCK